MGRFYDVKISKEEIDFFNKLSDSQKLILAELFKSLCVFVDEDNYIVNSDVKEFLKKIELGDKYQL